MIELDNKLVENYYEIAGHLVCVRIEPPEFRKQDKEISNLIDTGNFKEALGRIEQLPLEWINDKRFVYLAGVSVSFCDD